MKLISIRSYSISVFQRRFMVSSCFCLGLIFSSLQATPIPQNLGNGLDKLVESNLILKAAQAKGAGNVGTFNGYATQEAANYASLAMMDEQNRPMVRIYLDGRVALNQLRPALESNFRSLSVTATDKSYRAGVIEGYVSVEDVPALAQAAGVRSVVLSLKPRLRQKHAVNPAVDPNTMALGLIGTTFDQGVTQHRVDKINQIYNPGAPVNYNGNGISIGFLSDSFNTAPSSSAGNDVKNGDLPGTDNPLNSQPVVVLQDFPDGSDEGRGMVQIGYKMAPKARLGFATAFRGEVSFANNIRALAGLPGFTYPPDRQHGFAANAICDDVGYFDEPFFQDGIIGNGIDDVAAAGVAYFSSAANDIGTNGYDSKLRILPNRGPGLTAADNPTLVGTNINLGGVPKRLYQGGFHNFDPNGQDIAQLVNLGFPAIVVMQWDDPYDPEAGAQLGPQIYENSGTVTGPNPVVFDKNSSPPLPPLTAGQAYVITERHTSGDFDAIVSVIDPNNNTILTQDTGVDEIVTFTAPISGDYKISFSQFESTTGDFTFKLNEATVTQFVTSDFNLLVFRADNGAYISSDSLHADNLATNQPIELGVLFPPPGQTQVQFVIARSNMPANVPQPASHIRYLVPGNGLPNLGPAEYFDYHTPSTHGHATAKGCNGTAAYSVFRPSIPEFYTSPGPATIYFDKMNNRLPNPEVRLQPRVAAADGGNTSFFVADTTRDGDLDPNFFGTSAAAPHAAAIAALVLQAHGGPGSVTPAQMTSVLQRSAFLHDLDPFRAMGIATTANGGKVTVTILSDNEASPGTGLNDPNAIKISYDGPGNIATFSFNAAGLATHGGNVTGGNNGVDEFNTYFSNIYPGLVFDEASTPFIFGDSIGLRPVDVVASTSHAAPLPSTGQKWTLNLTFPLRNFSGGRVLRFGIGRDEQHTARVGTFDEPLGGFPFAGPDSGTTFPNGSGDLWGGGVLIPEGIVIQDGMRFSGTMGDGSTFSGTMHNTIGKGYSVLDGFGFINAEVAVRLPLQ
jgi:hypothetical protein